MAELETRKIAEDFNRDEAFRTLRNCVQQDPLVMSPAQELGAFDGSWMSLHETDPTMISYGAPDRARAKPNEMAAPMNALCQKRLEEMKFQLKAPELFKLG